MTEMSTRRALYDRSDSEMLTIRLKARKVSALGYDLPDWSPDVHQIGIYS